MNITVAIPSYNKEKYIKRCIESALQNKEHITKIILVDNNSTDKTLEIAKHYEPEIICYKNDSNLGMAKNWNRCIDLCETEWLLILHADDELLPNAIPKYEALIQKHPTLGLIHANSCSIVEGDLATKSFTTSTQKEFWSKGLEAMTCNYGVCSAVMVRKEVYDTLGYFIESLSSDAEMWSRIASKYDVGFITEPTVIYHVSKSSTGYESLIKRHVKDIKKDWDLLFTNSKS
jgi:GT2 family glycosyltransferase